MTKSAPLSPRYWIVVAARNHVRRAVDQGFIQANHGKKAPMKRLRKGDFVLCYSSKLSYKESLPCQRFTAIGQVTDHEPYTGIMSGSGFEPFRRNVTFHSCQEADIKPLIAVLTFIKDPVKWGFPFRRGFFEISEKDFLLISEHMDHVC